MHDHETQIIEFKSMETFLPLCAHILAEFILHLNHPEETTFAGDYEKTKIKGSGMNSQ